MDITKHSTVGAAQIDMIKKNELPSSLHYFVNSDDVLVSFAICFLNGPTPAPFCLFLFFSKIIFTEKNLSRQWDSNSDRQSRRRAQ